MHSPRFGFHRKFTDPQHWRNPVQVYPQDLRWVPMSPRLVIVEDEVAAAFTLRDLEQLQAVLQAARPDPKLL